MHYVYLEALKLTLGSGLSVQERFIQDLTLKYIIPSRVSVLPCSTYPTADRDLGIPI